jgi:hypothetical protein
MLLAKNQFKKNLSVAYTSRGICCAPNCTLLFCAACKVLLTNMQIILNSACCQFCLLPILPAANSACCQFCLLPILPAANSTCYQFCLLPILPVANSACCTSPILLAANPARCMPHTLKVVAVKVYMRQT